MRAVDFKHSNTVLRGWPEDTWPEDDTRQAVDDLHTFKDGTQIVSCWRPTWRERLSVLVFGRVWLGVLAPVTAPPIWLSGRRSVLNVPRVRNLSPREWGWLKAALRNWFAVVVVALLCSFTLTAAFVWLLEDLGLVKAWP